MQQKIKETFKKRYGFENCSQNLEIKGKIKNSFLNKYGVECNLLLDSTQEQIIQTNLKNDDGSIETLLITSNDNYVLTVMR